MSQDLIGKNQGWLSSRSLNTLAPAYAVLARKFWNVNAADRSAVASQLWPWCAPFLLLLIDIIVRFTRCLCVTGRAVFPTRFRGYHTCSCWLIPLLKERIGSIRIAQKKLRSVIVLRGLKKYDKYYMLGRPRREHKRLKIDPLWIRFHAEFFIIPVKLDHACNGLISTSENFQEKNIAGGKNRLDVPQPSHARYLLYPPSPSR